MNNNNNKVWKKDEIAHLLETSNKMVWRSVVKLYEYQTLDEQNSDITNHNNGVGFTCADAFILSQFAKYYNRNKFLTPKQTSLARRKMKKYAGQLTKIANEKIKFA
ncbi:MAG: hypothetical protein ACOC4B_01650 [Bacteroidota bacterium]